ncbi:hypothetical protein K0M31_017998, partial [Melipona bicolor]
MKMGKIKCFEYGDRSSLMIVSAQEDKASPGDQDDVSQHQFFGIFWGKSNGESKAKN